MDLVIVNQTPATPVREAIVTQVEGLLAQIKRGVATERRRHVRVAIPVLFRLTPLDEQREPVEGQAIDVVGKDISHRGISFIHNRPLPYRRARITLIQPGLGEFDVEIDIRWCRFTRPGWYESGGRLMRPVTRCGAETTFEITFEQG